MSTVLHLWIAALVFGAAGVLQWAVLRSRYRKELTKQHAKLVQHHQSWCRHTEQVKRQIAQLQHDLASARLQVKRLSTGRESQCEPDVKDRLERALDDAAASRQGLPADGFAETRPAPYAGREAALWIR